MKKIGKEFTKVIKGSAKRQHITQYKVTLKPAFKVPEYVYDPLLVEAQLPQIGNDHGQRAYRAVNAAIKKWRNSEDKSELEFNKTLLGIQNLNAKSFCTLLKKAEVLKPITPSETITFESNGTLSALLHKLRSMNKNWLNTDPENIGVIYKGVHLDNHRSTLHQLGFEDESEATVYIKGSFKIKVFHTDVEMEDGIVIEFNSCLDTVYNLKQKIFERLGIPKSIQVIIVDTEEFKGVISQKVNENSALLRYGLMSKCDLSSLPNVFVAGKATWEDLDDKNSERGKDAGGDSEDDNPQGEKDADGGENSGGGKDAAGDANGNSNDGGKDVSAGDTNDKSNNDGKDVSGKTVGVDPDKISESVAAFVNVDDKKLVIGSLSVEKCHQISHVLVCKDDFELSHSSKSTALYFLGYKPQTDLQESGSSDTEGSSKMSKVKIEDLTGKSKQEGDGGDEDMLAAVGDHFDEYEVDKEEVTTKKAEISKKWAADSATETPVPENYCQTSGGKKSVHTATPYPAKQVLKTSSKKRALLSATKTCVPEKKTKSLQTGIGKKSVHIARLEEFPQFPHCCFVPYQTRYQDTLKAKFEA